MKSHNRAHTAGVGYLGMSLGLLAVLMAASFAFQVLSAGENKKLTNKMVGNEQGSICNRLDALASEVESLKSALVAKEKELSQAQEKLRELSGLEGQMEACNRQIQSLTTDNESLQAATETGAGELNRLQGRMDQMSDDFKQMQSERDEKVAKIGSMQAEYTKALQERDNLADIARQQAEQITLMEEELALARKGVVSKTPVREPILDKPVVDTPVVGETPDINPNVGNPEGTPEIVGKILTASADNAVVDVGSDHQVKENMIFYVYRAGALVAMLKVEEVSAGDMSFCSIVKGDKPVDVYEGDLVSTMKQE